MAARLRQSDALQLGLDFAPMRSRSSSATEESSGKARSSSAGTRASILDCNLEIGSRVSTPTGREAIVKELGIAIALCYFPQESRSWWMPRRILKSVTLTGKSGSLKKCEK
ncbi:MAG: hypothetical protein MUC48_24670 [Leptolyngbya sp. Prado105]|nr:hypothetical protein [Leptolyngbya sp. Prado105]